MQSEFHSKIEVVNSLRVSRQNAAQFVIDNPIYFKELINLSFNASISISYKACWVLEFVAFEKLEWFADYLEFIFENLKNLTNESSIRPLAKIVQQILISHYSTSKTIFSLTEKQLQNCIEINFDWLLTDTKVATKAYAMRNLYYLGNQFDWIHPELKIILEKEYNHQSAAYKAVAREVLKKIK
jgi:hypothetical protein